MCLVYLYRIHEFYKHNRGLRHPLRTDIPDSIHRICYLHYVCLFARLLPADLRHSFIFLAVAPLCRFFSMKALDECGTLGLYLLHYLRYLVRDHGIH